MFIKTKKTIKSVLGITPSDIDLDLIKKMYKWSQNYRILSESQVNKLINLTNGVSKLNEYNRMVVTNCLNSLVVNGFTKSDM